MADTEENGSCKGKTPISYLQEICMKKCVTPQYDLVANEGAVHEPLFVFKVIAGDVIGTGKGPSKKKAKHNAAISALNQLLDCPNIAQLTTILSSPSNDTSTTGSPLLVDSIDCSSGNPVGELQEMTQKKMWPPPVYEYTSEQGPPHDRDFVCTARLFLHVEQAVGKSKKLAKRNAALAMLQRIKQGHIVPTDSSLSIAGNSSDTLVHVPNIEQAGPEKNETTDEENSGKNVTQRSDNLEKKKTSSMFLKSKNSKTGKILESLQALDLGPKDSVQNVATVASVDKQTQMLLDLAKEQRFDVIFHDAPSLSTKGLNQCLVELTTVPPSVMCGTGTSNELARKDAVKNALRILKILTK